jgi:hypothetical protein
MQRILVGTSVGIDCPHWFARAAPGTRNQTLSYTLTAFNTVAEMTNKALDYSTIPTVSFTMSPMGYGPDDSEKPQPKPKSHKKVVIIVIIIVLLLLAVIAGGLYYYFKIYKRGQRGGAGGQEPTFSAGLLDDREYSQIN